MSGVPPVFQRIVCGVDGTPESLVAVRQAVRLVDDDGSLLLSAAANLAKAAHAGMAATHAAELLQDEAQASLDEALKVAPSSSTKLVDGEAAAALLQQAEAERATLIAVGTHGHGRTAGLLLGSVATRMLRDATCSVLIARAARDVESWPRTVVVGVDGSAESGVAATVAQSVAERFGGSFRVLASTKDQLDREAAGAITTRLEEVDDPALDALVAVSESADLVIVGSRGLHGLKALGSVSERVAHQARASVLVVRPAPSA
jgi:nucleotide-binding universal stress UspA family protein